MNEKGVEMEDNKNNERTSGSIASTQSAKDENYDKSQSSHSKLAGDDAASKVGDVLRGNTDAVKDLFEQAKESGGDTAKQMLAQAKEKASTVISEQKTGLASGLGSIADGIRQMGENLREADDPHSIVEVTAKYGDNLAKQIEKVSKYLDQKDFKEMSRDVGVFARRNPAVFISGAFALGFLAIRLLKSSALDHDSKAHRQNHKPKKLSTGAKSDEKNNASSTQVSKTETNNSSTEAKSSLS